MSKGTGFEKLFTVPEAAKVFNRKEVTIRSWLVRGILSAHKINRCWLIPESEIGRLLEETRILARRTGS